MELGKRDNDKQIILECKGLCYLCLKDKGSQCDILFSYRNILKFLKLDRRIFFCRQVQLMCESKEMEVVVPLCQECYNLAQKFTAEYIVLEETKLQVHACLQRLCGVMKDAEEDSQRKIELRRRMSGGAISNVKLNADLKLLQNLRRETMNKYLWKSKQQFPRVMLKRFDEPTRQTDNEEGEEDVTVSPSLSPVSPYLHAYSLKANSVNSKMEVEVEGDGLNSSQEENQEDDSTNKYVSISSSAIPCPRVSLERMTLPTADLSTTSPAGNDDSRMEIEDGDNFEETTWTPDENNCSEEATTVSPMNESVSSSKSDQLQISDPKRCPYCKIQFTNHSLDLHLITFHCHHFFQSQEVVSRNATKFKEVIEPLLFQQFLKKESIPVTCPICQVEFCSNRFHQKRRITHLKLHLVRKHNQHLVNKLKNLLKSPDLQSKLRQSNRIVLTVKLLKSAKMKALNLVPGTTTCPHCDMTMSTHSSLNRHVIRKHCETLFKNVRDPSISSEDFKELVDTQLLRRVLRESNKSCVICNKVYWYNDSPIMRSTWSEKTRRHLVVSHKQVLIEKLLAIQEVFILGKSKNPEKNQASSSKKIPPLEVTVEGGYLTFKAAAAATATQNDSDSEESVIALYSPSKTGADDLECDPLAEDVIILEEKTPKSKEIEALNDDDEDNPIIQLLLENKLCPLCKLKFSDMKTKHGAEMHLAICHVEHFFTQTERKSESVSIEKFKLIMNQMIFPSLMKYLANNNCCSLCDQEVSKEKQWSRKYLMRLHLIKVHASILRQELKNIFEDPCIDEKLKMLTK